MHAAQPQQPRRAAASAAVPLEYFQCVYSHTTHSALTAASPRSQSAPGKGTHLQPLFQRPIRSSSSSSYHSSQSEATRAQQHCSSPAAAAGKQSSILEVQFFHHRQSDSCQTQCNCHFCEWNIPFYWNYYSDSCHLNRFHLIQEN